MPKKPGSPDASTTTGSSVPSIRASASARSPFKITATVAVNTEHLQVPPAAGDDRRFREQTFDLLVERPSIETNDGDAVPAHAGLHAVSVRAPGLAPAGSRVSKSTRMT